MVKSEKLLYRAAEAGEMLALGKSKVYELMNAGVLPSVRIGSAKRIPAEALRKWVETETRKQNGEEVDSVPLS